MKFFTELSSLIFGLRVYKLILWIFSGLGLGAEVVAGFADAHKSAIESGFPDTIDTYGLVSGLWTSIFALGAFIGPSMAGILFDNIGFEWATLFIIIIHILVVILLIAFKLCHKGYEKTTQIPN
jgi:MFS family permease